MDATRTAERPRELFRTKLGHVYLIRYRKGQEDAVADQLARWVANQELNLTWFEACEMGDELDG